MSYRWHKMGFVYWESGIQRLYCIFCDSVVSESGNISNYYMCKNDECVALGNLMGPIRNLRMYNYRPFSRPRGGER